jgi:predicted enzyme related to lactoylglutathione lyase
MTLPPGVFGWVDLMTTDVPTCKAFYGELFGWTSVDMPMGPDYAYTQFFKDGKVVAGVGPMPPGGPQMPVVWSSYVMVDDADAVLAGVPGAGGLVIAPVMDIPSQGRMAMIADPSGAVVGLWQPMEHTGAELFNAPGSLTWNELQTRDLGAAMAFYADVFGWTWSEGPGDTGYQMGSTPVPDAEPRMNCGAMAMPPGVPDEVPSFWAVYFAVEDCDTSLALAESLGGTVFLPGMDMGPGRFGGVTDPTGGMFFLGHFPQGQE